MVMGNPGTVVARKRNVWSTPNVILAVLFMVIILQGIFYAGQQYSNQYYSHRRFNATKYMLEKFDETLNMSQLMLNRIDVLETSASKNRDDSSQADHVLTTGLDSLRRSATSLEEMIQHENAKISSRTQELADGLHNLQQSIERMIQEEHTKLSNRVQELDNQLSNLHQSSSLVHLKLNTQLSDSVEFRPLKDLQTWPHHGDNGEHGFLSDIIGRGRKEGPPELFYFPSANSSGRLLCIRGNDTSNGTRNSYAYAYKDALPRHSILLNGTTLISDTYWDYTNPWHSMYNLIQFLHWKMNGLGCQESHRILLFHWSELRTELGYWIKNIFDACNLPTEPDNLNYGDRPVCFESAVVSRIGIGGVPPPILRKIYEEARCQARRKCKVAVTRQGPREEKRVRVTLLVRTGARGFLNVKDWLDVISNECTPVRGCTWQSMAVSKLSFCEQVQMMTDTDILVSVHGAQLTNMAFMSPGSRILEMFPRGWLEFASHGQYIYSHLANWVGLKHEGYWRDLSGPSCPNPNDASSCFSYYKDQSIGINATHISSWLGTAIDDFNDFHTEQLRSPSSMSPLNGTLASIDKSKFVMTWDNATCTCAS